MEKLDMKKLGYGFIALVAMVGMLVPADSFACGGGGPCGGSRAVAVNVQVAISRNAGPIGPVGGPMPMGPMGPVQSGVIGNHGMPYGGGYGGGYGYRGHRGCGHARRCGYGRKCGHKRRGRRFCCGKRRGRAFSFNLGIRGPRGGFVGVSVNRRSF